MFQTPSLSVKPSQRSAWPLLAVIALLSVLNAASIFRPYSYWLDELATLSLFNVHHGGLWLYLMQDNFPPLYFLLIQGWSFLFGHGEISLRLLSLLCVAGAMTAVGFFVKRYESNGCVWPVFSVALLGTLPTVAYYTQEVRPYGLLLFLASWTVTSAVAVVKRPADQHSPYTEPWFYFSALLVSLTHYFGLILVILLAVANIFFLKPIQKWRNCMLLGACSVWPLIHGFHSRLLTQAGGNFWIQVDPIVGTLKVLFVTVPFLCLLLPLALVSVLPFFWRQGLAGEASLRRSLSYLALVFVSFVVLMLLLDIHTPLSLPRYYVSIIPVAVLLVVELTQAVVLQANKRVFSTAFAILACSLLAAQLVKAQQRIALKSTPDQNWKGLSEIVRRYSICKEGCDALGYSTWGEYYFSGIAMRNLDPAASRQWSTFPIRRPLLGFHRAASLIPPLLAANPGVVCLEPKQSIPGSTFLMADPRLLPPGIREQLLPCTLDSKP